ncbi:MAG TPA: hypothetical protein VI756_01110 [Blastocatellia bacterium]
MSSVAGLRDYFGLEKRLGVRVREPYQMLGMLDEDLKQAMGIDVEGVYRPETSFGFRNRDWKSWRMPDGLELLVSEVIRVTRDTNGDILLHPQNDLSAPRSRRMPKDSYFLDAIIRQPPMMDEESNPEDNLEEFKLLREQDFEQMRGAASGSRCHIGAGGGHSRLPPRRSVVHPPRRSKLGSYPTWPQSQPSPSPRVLVPELRMELSMRGRLESKAKPS